MNNHIFWQSVSRFVSARNDNVTPMVAACAMVTPFVYIDSDCCDRKKRIHTLSIPPSQLLPSRVTRRSWNFFLKAELMSILPHLMGGACSLLLEVWICPRKLLIWFTHESIRGSVVPVPVCNESYVLAHRYNWDIHISEHILLSNTVKETVHNS